MNFEFRQQDIFLQFDADAGVAERIRARPADAAPAELNVNALMSRPDLLVMQSPTSSTVVEIAADRAVMRTRYFDDFVEMGRFAERAAYARRKAERLLTVLGDAGAQLRFIGLVSLARSPVRETTAQDEIRRRLQKLGGVGLLSEGSLPFDFLLRVSRVADEDRYSNVQLSWYQERTFSLTLDNLGPERTAYKQLHDWEMPLSDEGLELRYDQNNKRGLHGGRRDWSAQLMLSVIDRYFADLAPAVTKITTQLSEA
jgi:hypothetical protein